MAHAQCQQHLPWRRLLPRLDQPNFGAGFAETQTPFVFEQERERLALEQLEQPEVLERLQTPIDDGLIR
mgnify:CR=1 FL=1